MTINGFLLIAPCSEKKLREFVLLRRNFTCRDAVPRACMIRILLDLVIKNVPRSNDETTIITLSLLLFDGRTLSPLQRMRIGWRGLSEAFNQGA